MNRKQKLEKPESYGRLPAVAPLANPYVPFQPESAEQYDAQKAIVRGTLYPGLDLPFKGIVNKNNLPMTPQSELKVIAFAIQELALYLDTHKEDHEAIELYHRYQQLYRHHEEEYSRRYSPVTHNSVEDGNNYRWLDDPWPWEYCSNQRED